MLALLALAKQIMVSACCGCKQLERNMKAVLRACLMVAILGTLAVAFPAKNGYCAECTRPLPTCRTNSDCSPYPGCPECWAGTCGPFRD